MPAISSHIIRPGKRAMLVIIAAFAPLGACSEHKDPTLPQQKKDPALQSALDELTRLSSFTETGLNYNEYSDRLLTAKGNIDVALQRTSDQPAKERINLAVSCYVEARTEWKMKLDSKYHAGVGPQHYWQEATAAASLAAEYAFADQTTRQQIDAREQAKRERERKADQKLAEEKRKADQKLAEEDQKALQPLVERYRAIKSADEKRKFLEPLSQEDKIKIILAQ